MTDIKMSNTFDLPVSDGDFTLVAMNKSTYVSMDRAAVIAINSYDLNQERIAELEKYAGDLVAEKIVSEILAEERIAELEKDIAFLQSCVNSGETASKADRPSNQFEALKEKG